MRDAEALRSRFIPPLFFFIQTAPLFIASLTLAFESPVLTDKKSQADSDVPALTVVLNVIFSMCLSIVTSKSAKDADASGHHLLM
jgi:hypothetical protein